LPHLKPWTDGPIAAFDVSKLRFIYHLKTFADVDEAGSRFTKCEVMKNGAHAQIAKLVSQFI
jgi:hypothetical protein